VNATEVADKHSQIVEQGFGYNKKQREAMDKHPMAYMYYLAGHSCSASRVSLMRAGRVGLNSDRQRLSGSSAGCFLDLPTWGVMQGGRSRPE
jgi:hypothetical protein